MFAREMLSAWPLPSAKAPLPFISFIAHWPNSRTIRGGPGRSWSRCSSGEFDDRLPACLKRNPRAKSKVRKLSQNDPARRPQRVLERLRQRESQRKDRPENQHALRAEAKLAVAAAVPLTSVRLCLGRGSRAPKPGVSLATTSDWLAS